MSNNRWSASEQEAIREELDCLLNSGALQHSRRRQRFLEYIVKETVAGRGGRLKGYTVALEVFDRPETFDANDALVRVEAARLREKLREYYATDGQSDPIRIELAKGTYMPEIEFQQPATPPDPSSYQPAGTPKVAQQGRNRDAHLELLRGLERFWRYSRQSCTEAQHHFAKAVALDPDYAAARSWLARTYVFQYGMNWNGDFQTTMDPAIEHARRAVELDAQSPYARSILGWVGFFMKDGENALSDGRLACALHSDFAEFEAISFIFSLVDGAWGRSTL